jgi:2-polyprenyl-3-methyl-5-hydroxy-6-metoxy-1,4-benzoquinol methylase
MGDNESYWEKRHETYRHRLSAVGDIRRSEDENAQLFSKKKQKVCNVLRDMQMIDLLGLRVLDAGCGIGLLSELFYVLGAEVSGVDASAIAITDAKNRCPGSDFQVASLLDFRFGYEFDVTFCIDVLYHIVNDDNWRIVVGNLVSHTRPSGAVIILDQIKTQIVAPAPHVRYRTQSMYNEAMGLLGLHNVTPDGHSDFLVYRNGNRYL